LRAGLAAGSVGHRPHSVREGVVGACRKGGAGPVGASRDCVHMQTASVGVAVRPFSVKATLEPAYCTIGSLELLRNAPAHVLSGLFGRAAGRVVHAALPTSQQQVRPTPGAVQAARLAMVVQLWASAPQGSRPVATKAGD
jgi:hypothetical protein